MITRCPHCKHEVAPLGSASICPNCKRPIAIPVNIKPPSAPVSKPPTMTRRTPDSSPRDQRNN